MARVRIELDHGGMESLLKSKRVEAMTAKIAARVAAGAAAADPHHHSGELEYFVHSKVGRGRAFSWVSNRHPIGKYLESKYHPLRNAMMGAKW